MQHHLLGCSLNPAHNVGTQHHLLMLLQIPGDHPLIHTHKVSYLVSMLSDPPGLSPNSDLNVGTQQSSLLSQNHHPHPTGPSPN